MKYCKGVITKKIRISEFIAFLNTLSLIHSQKIAASLRYVGHVLNETTASVQYQTPWDGAKLIEDEHILFCTVRCFEEKVKSPRTISFDK